MASVTVAHAFDLIWVLAGHSFDGLRNGQLAEAVSQSASTTLRRLQALETLGLVERVPGIDDRWRLSPKLIRLAIAHQAELARLTQRLDEFTNRYSRQP